MKRKETYRSHRSHRRTNSEEERVFNFRIIESDDKKQVIDPNLKTPENALTPDKLIEYIEMDKQITIMNRMKKKQEKEEERKQRWSYKLVYKFAETYGII